MSKYRRIAFCPTVKKDLSCEECIRLLPAYCDKNLDGFVMDRVEQHLRSCERCLEEYDKLLSIDIEENFDKPDPDDVNLRNFISDEKWERRGREQVERLTRYAQERRVRIEILIFERNGYLFAFKGNELWVN